MPSSRSHASAALLIIDVINDLDFPGGEKVLPWAEKMADRLDPLRRRAHQAELPVIYVNDNFGNWRSDFRAIYRHCTRPGARGRSIARRLKPGADDYFVLKPRHSGFYATSLVPLLEHLNVRTLILSGMATNICVLITAHDAYMREYKTLALSDCCAAESDFDHDVALKQLQTFCKTKVCRSDQLDLRTLKVSAS